jgi:hypothetical protein
LIFATTLSCNAHSQGGLFAALKNILKKVFNNVVCLENSCNFDLSVSHYNICLMKISIATHGKQINHLAWGAIRRFKSNGKVLSWKEAFHFAVGALSMKERLSTGVVNFAFVKVSTNETRLAKGTRDLANIPVEFHPKGTSTKPETTNVVSYFDLDSKGWRSFDVTNLVPSLV